MPITENDVQQFVAAYERVGHALDDGAPREAAKVLCGEFSQLLTRESFWQGIGTVMPKISEYQKEGQEILFALPRFMDYENQILLKLGIRSSTAQLILRDVFGTLREAMVASQHDDQTLVNLGALQQDLGKATALVCSAGGSRFQRARDYLMSWKGARVLAGGALMAANVLVFTVDGGAFSWASVQAGAVIMSGNALDLVNMLSRED